MTIHHAIVKSAAAKGIVLTQDDDAIHAKHAESGFLISLAADAEDTENDTAKRAHAEVADMAEWLALDEAKGWTLEVDTSGYSADHEDGRNETADSWEDLLEAIRASQPEADEGEGDEDEATASGSVVPDRFKVLYREIGVRGQDNGDTLAAAMANYCIVLDGRAEVVDCEKVEALAYRNGVDYPLEGYNTASRGWQGRFRMTTGNMLRKKVADAKLLIVPASLTNGKGEIEIVPSDEFVAKYATKPKTKAAKKEADEAAAQLAAPVDETPSTEETPA